MLPVPVSPASHWHFEGGTASGAKLEAPSVQGTKKLRSTRSHFCAAGKSYPVLLLNERYPCLDRMVATAQHGDCGVLTLGQQLLGLVVIRHAAGGA